HHNGGFSPDMPRPRVLLIDDSRTAQAAFGIGLEEAGFEVLVAGDAREALQILSQHRSALVLADYQLPGTNDLHLLAAVRGAYSEPPWILEFAPMPAVLAGQAKAFGGAAVLEEAVAPARLVEVVRTALATTDRGAVGRR